MTPVTVVGMVAGGLLILVVVIVFLQKKAFPAGGVGSAAIGFILIGMSQWTTIKIKAGGVDIDLSAIQAQLDETATAVDSVAGQSVRTAAVAEATREQLVTLSGQLADRQVLPRAAVNSVQRSLSVHPKLDTTRVITARTTLRPPIRR
jgi:hypothetical protein